jgi:hypothetical protein
MEGAALIMDTILVNSHVGAGAAPDWSTLHWGEMKHVFDVDEENLSITAGRDPVPQAGMWPLIDWHEIMLLLNEDEGAVTKIEDTLHRE